MVTFLVIFCLLALLGVAATEFLEIHFAKNCAWRCIYIFKNNKEEHTSIFMLGFDPDTSWGVRPRLFGRIFNKDFSYQLPALQWKYQASWLRRKAYYLQMKFIHGMDGRYGWGTKKK